MMERLNPFGSPCLRLYLHSSRIVKTQSPGMITGSQRKTQTGSAQVSLEIADRHEVYGSLAVGWPSRTMVAGNELSGYEEMLEVNAAVGCQPSVRASRIPARRRRPCPWTSGKKVH
jgi:hypothetical protein